MQYQTFRGADVKQALHAVKAALGPDAVITSTRHVSNGRGGALGQSFVEITAARPEVQKQQWPFSPDILATAEPPRVRRSRLLRPAKAGTQRDAISSLLGPSTRELEREIQVLRSMLDELNSARPPRERALAMLYAAGIEGPLAKELVANISRGPRHSAVATRSLVVERIRERLQVTPDFIVQPERQMIVCVGPTGAGKTTTLAKLAARARLDHRRPISVISLDTFRVGAIEQWQKYAQLMGIVFHVASNAEEFKRVASGLQSDLVLVDTSGRGPKEASPDWCVIDCLKYVGQRTLNVLAVLPAWLRGRDAEHVVNSYSDLGITAAVVTKLDEAMQCGGALQSLMVNELPVAYTCHGPRVPEDIRRGHPDTLLQWLLPADA